MDESSFGEDYGGTYRSGLVAIIGPPNAGKSTLLNQFLGQKVAIVSPKPQTTRNQISGILSTDEAQVVFLDTPGVHKSGQRFNRYMVDAAWRALTASEAVLLVLDAGLYLARPQLLERDTSLMRKRVQQSGNPVFLALNKTDTIKDKSRLLPLLQRLSELWPEAELHPISALRGNETDALLSGLLGALPEGPPLYPEDQISTLPMRFMTAEIIREKLFLALEKELPYNLAVIVEQWEERPTGISVYATIYVARPSQKAIVIGKGGRLLKEIGQQSRLELAEMIEKPVHLDLWVKVKKRWHEDMSFLGELGLTE
ncbi:GTPase Era [Desulfohalobium retbaense]|uniref:GTPase Era n=1 Tax=Desulfohalobium retbaense (strain ATCC 49708 / DSM 5692 / JCM 16813 / HR100) TaxID=485915 RepID=C8WZB1_DESRD|nr:GTPase Era [Desulfohalobium retbaense]ACV67386.1 GTP-binding protein Era [Desulfohalobium retbaense DSM 5692]